jgi:hypothetical protein
MSVCGTTARAPPEVGRIVALRELAATGGPWRPVLNSRRRQAGETPGQLTAPAPLGYGVTKRYVERLGYVMERARHPSIVGFGPGCRAQEAGGQTVGERSPVARSLSRMLMA